MPEAAEPKSDWDVSWALADDAATIGARTPVDTAAVAAPSPAIKRRRPGDLGPPSNSGVRSTGSSRVPDQLLPESSLAINHPHGCRRYTRRFTMLPACSNFCWLQATRAGVKINRDSNS